MRKKLVATLMAGAIASVGLVGLTACGGDENSEIDVTDGVLRAGEEVTAEEWKEAIDATCVLYGDKVGFPLNYTAGMCYYVENYYSSAVDEDAQISDAVYMTSRTTEELHVANTVDKVEMYGLGKVVVEYKNVPEESSGTYEDMDMEVVQTYTTFNDKVYLVTYDKSLSDDKTNYRVSSQDISEYVDSDAGVSFEYSSGSELKYCLDGFSTEKGGKTTPLSDAYELFTYSNGFYTAKGYDSSNEYTFIVSIKDGRLIGISAETALKFDIGNGLKEIQKVKITFEFKDFDTTTVPEIPEDVLAEIEKYIKENEDKN